MRKKFKFLILCVTMVSMLVGMIPNTVSATKLSRKNYAVSAQESWIRLGSTTINPKTELQAYSVFFGAVTYLIPGGYVVKAVGGTFTTIFSTASLVAGEGKIESTQYRSSGSINYNTKIKTVSKYYAKNTSGGYTYISTVTQITTLGDIYNTYNEREIH